MGDKRIRWNWSLLKQDGKWTFFFPALEDEDGMTDEDSVMLPRRPRARWRRRRGHIFVSAWRYWTRAMKGERESTAKPRLSLAKLQCSSEIWQVWGHSQCVKIVCLNIPPPIHRGLILRWALFYEQRRHALCVMHVTFRDLPWVGGKAMMIPQAVPLITHKGMFMLCTEMPQYYLWDEQLLL